MLVISRIHVRGRFDNFDVPLVVLKHLRSLLVSPRDSGRPNRIAEAAGECRDHAAHLLRASLVDDLGVVLRLVTILPGEVDHQLARLLVVAGVDGLDLILPGADWRFPRSGAHGGCRRSRMAVVPSLLRPIGRGAGARAATLLGLRPRLGLLYDLLLAANALEICFEDFGSALPSRKSHVRLGGERGLTMARRRERERERDYQVHLPQVFGGLPGAVGLLLVTFPLDLISYCTLMREWMSKPVFALRQRGWRGRRVGRKGKAYIWVDDVGEDLLDYVSEVRSTAISYYSISYGAPICQVEEFSPLTRPRPSLRHHLRLRHPGQPCHRRRRHCRRDHCRCRPSQPRMARPPVSNQ